MPEVNYKKLTIAVIAIAIIIRIILSSLHTISGDACWHYTASKFIANEKRFPLHEQIGRDEPFWPPPLFHIISAVFYKVTGNFGLKLVPLIFGILTLIFSYKIFKMLFDERNDLIGTQEGRLSGLRVGKKDRAVDFGFSHQREVVGSDKFDQIG